MAVLLLLIIWISIGFFQRLQKLVDIAWQDCLPLKYEMKIATPAYWNGDRGRVWAVRITDKARNYEHLVARFIPIFSQRGSWNPYINVGLIDYRSELDASPMDLVGDNKPQKLTRFKSERSPHESRQR